MQNHLLTKEERVSICANAELSLSVPPIYNSTRKHILLYKVLKIVCISNLQFHLQHVFLPGQYSYHLLLILLIGSNF